MSPFEIINIAQSTGERLDAQWAMFITVHLALLGAIIYIDRPLRRLEKLGFVAIYGAFAIFNYRVTLRHRDLLERCAEQLSQIGQGKADLVMGYFSDLDESGHFAQAELTITGLHLFAMVVVLLAVVFDRALKPK